jgi:cell division protein FtsN
MPGPRLTTRDFKTPALRRQASAGRWRDMGVGLGLGLLVAVLVYVKDHRAAPAEAAPSKKSTIRETGDATKGKPDAADDPTTAHYDFYDKLLKDEVIPPEKGQAVRSLPPTAKISQPGTYVLQGGVFRQTDDAERMRAKLAKLGITATVQRISVDDDVWHRIRIGPINNLEQLNHVLDQLHRADIDPIVTRAGD